MEETKRRDFLRAGLGAAVALGSPWLSSSQASPLVPKSKRKSLVAAIRGKNLDAMTRDAIDALGGMPAVVDKGETVFIKPNLVSFPWAKHNKCFHIGDCTKPEIIIAVADECLKAGAAEVIIGEGSQMPTFEWQHAITLDGNTNLVKETARLSSKYDGRLPWHAWKRTLPVGSTSLRRPHWARSPFPVWLPRQTR